jgi:hypothetical protein
LPDASSETPAQRPVVQKLSSPNGAVLLQLLSSRRLQRSWVFDIFCQKMSGNVSCEFKKRSQFIIRARDETLSVTAVRIDNKDGSPVGINRGDAAPAPTGLTELIGNAFPLLHTFIVCRRRTFHLLWRSVYSNGNFCTHSTDHFLCTWHTYEFSSGVVMRWLLLLARRSRTRMRIL